MDVSTDCGTTPAVDDDMADSQGTVLHVDLQFVLGEIQNFRMISHFLQKFVLWQKLPFECFFFRIDFSKVSLIILHTLATELLTSVILLAYE